ncbi:MAG: coproporphyrinogen dehydrogenase HemZ [Clostridia bacterium]|nr:coproporphyrinogen dehydrogenase HemZ [Clostridia bacterium]
MSETTKTPWGILTGIRPAKLATKLLREGKTDKDVMDYFLNECGTTPEKAALALETAKAEMPVEDAMDKDGISLYVGIPFCPTRCLYCSFVTCGTRQAAKLIPEYLECLKKEIAFAGKLTADNGKHLETVYIGGGTPTTLSADQLHELLSQIEDSFALSSCKEFTVEAGRPDTVTAEKLKTLRQHGVNRISINPQSMNTETLHTIGRAHTPDDIRGAMELARDCGFDCINMDVIAGLPGETFEMFRYTMEEVEKLKPENTTVHTMSIKRSSRLHEYLGDYALTDGAQVETMVDFAYRYMKELGKHPYYMYRQKNQLGNLENVGYCKPGTENLYNIYIMEELQTILSVGCGGVTKTVDPVKNKIERIFNVKEPQDYIARLDEMIDRKKNMFEEL